MADGKVWATEANTAGRRLARTVDCPTCGPLPAGAKCRTELGKPTALVHRPRWNAVQPLIMPGVQLRRVLREAYASAGTVQFARRQLGEHVELYDILAEAVLDEFHLTPKEV
jgi:hypothetical protein